MSRNILFVSHESSATGAPIVFRNIIRKLCSELLFNSYLFVIKEGHLKEEFDSLCDFSNTDCDIPSNWPSFDLIYFNSIESSHIYDKLLEGGNISDKTQIILHTHEMIGTLEKYGIERSKTLMNVADEVFCASSTVKDSVVNIGFSPEKCTVIKPYVSINSSKLSKSNSKKIILSCGEISFNKGIDYFLQLAKKYFENNQDSEYKFIWVGPDTRKLKALVEWDIEKLGLVDRVKFIGYSTKVLDIMRQADLFLLPSRQDSFPTVCLEALSEGLPILYFKESGGMRDFLNEQCSFPVKYFDIDEGYNKLVRIIESNPPYDKEKSKGHFKKYVDEMNQDMLNVLNVVKKCLL